MSQSKPLSCFKRISPEFSKKIRRVIRHSSSYLSACGNHMWQISKDAHDLRVFLEKYASELEQWVQSNLRDGLDWSIKDLTELLEKFKVASDALICGIRSKHQDYNRLVDAISEDMAPYVKTCPLCDLDPIPIEFAELKDDGSSTQHVRDLKAKLLKMANGVGNEANYYALRSSDFDNKQRCFYHDAAECGYMPEKAQCLTERIYARWGFAKQVEDWLEAHWRELVRALPDFGISFGGTSECILEFSLGELNGPTAELEKARREIAGMLEKLYQLFYYNNFEMCKSVSTYIPYAIKQELAYDLGCDIGDGIDDVKCDADDDDIDDPDDTHIFADKNNIADTIDSLEDLLKAFEKMDADHPVPAHC